MTPSKGTIELVDRILKDWDDDYRADPDFFFDDVKRFAALIDDHFKPAKEALDDVHAYIHTIRMPNKIALKQRDNTNDLIETALKCWGE